MLKRKHKLEACVIALLSFMFLTATLFGQGTGASLTGTVQDASGGVLANASILARNVDTGVEARTTSNDRGNYTFPSLQIGTYSITATMAGFSPSAHNVRLGGTQNTLNITMAVAGAVTEVDVTGTAESVILEAGASTGTVMQEEILQSVPLLSNNLMQLVNMMGGVTPATDPVFGAANQTFAGVTAGSGGINVTRDGMSVSEFRFNTGINAATNINPEMVSEFRMILSPVDAEMGRGAGQVQITTRSGANAFHGSGTWNIQNSALDARSFGNKLNNVPKPWRNVNSYQLTGSGPIVRNKTFFFVTWEQQFSRNKSVETPKVLTDCARKGIYRYLDGWYPGAATENMTANPNAYTRPAVDNLGNILYGGQFYNSQTNESFTDPDRELRFESIFGPLDPNVRAVLADKSNPGSAHGDCSALSFNGITGQFGVDMSRGTMRPGAWDQRPWTPTDPTNPRTGAAYRDQYDQSGFVNRFTNGIDYAYGHVVMPPVNNWNVGDGLNYAGHRWNRTVIGEGSSIYGTGGDPDRKSLTLKIDHNLNNNHRISGTYTYEAFLVGDAYPTWPEMYGGYGGTITRDPHFVQFSMTSTLRPTLLNEFRVGLSRSMSYTKDALRGADGEKMQDLLRTLFPTGAGSMFAGTPAQDLVMLLGAGESPLLFHADSYAGGNLASYPVGGRSASSGNISMTWGGADNRWTISDTVTWMKGAHSFKGGVDLRLQSSFQEFGGSRGFATNMFMGVGSHVAEPTIFGGANTGTQERRRGMLGQYAPGGALHDPLNPNWLGLPPVAQDSGTTNATGSIYTTPYSMMTYFSGALSELRQFFYAVPDISRPYGARWNDITSGEDMYDFTIRNRELSFFFKDDWKVNNSLTLNLGVRWEYYGIPGGSDGRTLALKGGSQNAYGLTMKERGEFETLFTQEREYVVTRIGEIPDIVTQYEFIGSGSPNPDRRVFNRDMNNFAPHLGFSWQLPWFGRGLTTLRGGWSVSYSQIDTFDQFGVTVVDNGAAYLSNAGRFMGVGQRNDLGTSAHYMDIMDLPRLLPLNGNDFGVEPMKPIEMGHFRSSVTTYDENIKNPYTHSVNLSLTRNLGRNFTVDVRYIGTLQRDRITGLSLNGSNYISSGLYKEFEKIRRGEQSDLINSLIPGQITGTTVPGTGSNYPTGSYILRANLTAPMNTFGSGSDQLYSISGQASNLALRTYSGIATTLATTNGQMGTTYSGESGRHLRAAGGCLPQHRLDPNGNMMDHVNNPCEYYTPWNYYYTNPQLSGATINTNALLSNYHSMQTQVTMRPTRGLNFQATWTWSRNLSESGTYTNYFRGRNYTLSGQHRSHQLNTYGTWELPFGARGFFFRDASGITKKLIEGWQLGWITVMNSGSPASVTGSSVLFGENYPILVRPDLWDNKSGHVTETWDGDRFVGGRYYGDRYTKVLDRNICNTSDIMGDWNTANTHFHQYCEYNATGSVRTLRGSAPRALALASGERNADGTLKTDSTGAILPMRYSSLQEARQYDPTAEMDVVGFDPVTRAPIYDNPPVIVFRNATMRDFDPNNPGAYIGNFGANTQTGVGSFTFDMNMTKRVEFMEGKSIEVRVDAQNILNHPSASPGAAVSVSGSGAIGTFTSKGGYRRFQAKLSLRF